MEQAPSGEDLTKEIERKFLVRKLPEDLDLTRYEYEKIYQGYLISTPERAVRIRRKGYRFFWTFKGSTDYVAERIELETEISEEQFLTMWPATRGKRVEKTRYKIPYGNHTIELDVFEGRDAGNMMAEVEFDSHSLACSFDPMVPDWFGKEVTEDERYSNACISEHGFPPAE